MLNKIVNSKVSKKSEALRENLRKRKQQKIARINQKNSKSNNLTLNQQTLENIK